jgi:hypothetical protein
MTNTGLIDERALVAKKERWLIVSWAHQDLIDGKYGRLLEVYEGHQQGAEWRARNLLDEYSDIRPIGIVQEVV